MSAEEDRLRYLQLKAKAGGPAVEAPAADPQGGPVRERTTRQNIADRTNQFSQGLSSGWIDEGAAALEATMDAVRGNEILDASGEPADWGTRRSNYLDRLNTDRDIYSREHPVQSAALEIGGGLVQALATRKLPTGKLKLPGGPLAKNKLPQSLKRRAGKEIARASAEGALYGAGTAEEGSRLEGAAKGAAADVATNLVLKGAGKGLKAATTNRYAQNLKEKGREFLPLSVVSDGKIGQFYEDYIARSPWGGRKVREQTEAVVGDAERNLDRVVEKTNALPATIAGEEAAAKSSAEGRRVASRAAAGEQLSDVTDVIDTTRAAEKLNIDEQAAGQRLAAEADSQAVTAAADSARRVGQGAKTLPPHAPEELREFVATTDDPTAVARAIDTWWQKEGFQDIKGNRFEVDDELEGFLERYVDEGDLDEIVDEGFVTGEWLMEMRNNPARGSGSAGDYARGKLRMEVKDFDNEMERMLLKEDSPEALEILKRYKDEIGFYGDKQAYVNAVDKAQTKRGGNFNADDLATAGPKRQRRYGAAPGQVAGQQGQREAAESTSALAQTKKRLDADKKARQAESSARAKQFKKDATDENAAAGTAADKQKVQDTRKNTLRIKRASRRADAAEKLKQANSRVKLLKAMMPNTNAAGVGGRVNSAASPGMIKRGLITAAGGGATALGAGTEGVQTFIAGQTEAQRLMAELLRLQEEPLTLAREALGRYSAGQGE
jgi:hypothetical protein